MHRFKPTQENHFPEDYFPKEFKNRFENKLGIQTETNHFSLFKTYMGCIYVENTLNN